MTLYTHQQKGIPWLAERAGAGLFWEPGCGKSRTALFAAKILYDKKKIDRVLILAPSTVCNGVWINDELPKLNAQCFNYNLLSYNVKKQKFFADQANDFMPIAVISYGLLSQKRHVEAIEQWLREGRCALIADESSYLKNRTAKQTKAALLFGAACKYRWLLSGTPVCNSPLDMYSQGKIIAHVGGPLGAYKNFYHFQASIGNLIPVLNRNNKPLMIVGRGANGRVGPQAIKRFEPHAAGLEKLQKLFAPYVSRVEKADCLDLPPKSYTVREVALSEATWKIYQELKREAMIALPDSEAKPEPNAAVRILRLCQLTSGHVGGEFIEWCAETQSRLGPLIGAPAIGQVESNRDISSEKLDFLAEEIANGELANERALIVWCRWRRERERLFDMLKNDIALSMIHGGQTQVQRDMNIRSFQELDERRVLLAQPHAGGFGLNLTAAHTAVYLSNDFSYATRVQSEDRCHRIGQAHPVLYIDVVAVSPRGGQTIDHKILEALRMKKSVAEWTTSAWRRALENE